MVEVLREPLEPVLRDLARAGLEAPAFEDGDWTGDPERLSSTMCTADGTGAGVAVTRAASLVERGVEATAVGDREPPLAPRTDQLARGAHDTPPTVARGAQAVWACPGDGTRVAPIGSIEEAVSARGAAAPATPGTRPRGQW